MILSKINKKLYYISLEHWKGKISKASQTKYKSQKSLKIKLVNRNKHLWDNKMTWKFEGKIISPQNFTIGNLHSRVKIALRHFIFIYNFIFFHLFLLNGG